jgi:hypothetical protein
VFFTTAHYRDRVEATSASFVPFGEEYDAHDLVVANPERESRRERGGAGARGRLTRFTVSGPSGSRPDRPETPQTCRHEREGTGTGASWHQSSGRV